MKYFQGKAFGLLDAAIVADMQGFEKFFDIRRIYNNVDKQDRLLKRRVDVGRECHFEMIQSEEIDDMRKIAGCEALGYI